MTWRRRTDRKNRTPPPVAGVALVTFPARGIIADWRGCVWAPNADPKPGPPRRSAVV